MVQIGATHLAVPLRIAGPDLLLGRFMCGECWMLWFVFWVYVAPSIILAIVTRWLGSGLDVSRHTFFLVSEGSVF